MKAVLRRLGLTGGPASAQLTVLLYHRVLTVADPLLPAEPDAAGFDGQMALLARLCNVLPLAEALERLRSGSLPSRAVSITFDDGYRDNLGVAMPILRRHGLTATFFIATGFLDGGIMMHDTAIEAVRRMPAGTLDLEWVGLGHRHIDDMSSRSALIGDFVGRVKYMALAPRRAACERLAALSPAPLPRDLMMTSTQVRQMHDAGMHIGAHTHDHPILAQQSLTEARDQIGRNREVLTQLIGSVPRLFAYPNGKPKLDYADEHVALVKQAGFEAAVSVSFGTVTRNSDHFQIPRFIPWDSAPAKVAFRVLTHPLRYPAPRYA